MASHSTPASCLGGRRRRGGGRRALLHGGREPRHTFVPPGDAALIIMPDPSHQWSLRRCPAPPSDEGTIIITPHSPEVRSNARPLDTRVLTGQMYDAPTVFMAPERSDCCHHGNEASGGIGRLSDHSVSFVWSCPGGALVRAQTPPGATSRRRGALLSLDTRWDERKPDSTRLVLDATRTPQEVTDVFYPIVSQFSVPIAISYPCKARAGGWGWGGSSPK